MILGTILWVAPFAIWILFRTAGPGRWHWIEDWAIWTGSYAVYFYVTAVVTLMVPIRARWRWAISSAMPILLYLPVAGESGLHGFPLRARDVWSLPGYYLSSPPPGQPGLVTVSPLLALLLLVSPPAGRTVARPWAQLALPSTPDEWVLFGPVEFDSWAAVARLSNHSLQPLKQQPMLPGLDLIAPRPDGTALAAYRKNTAVGILSPDGVLTDWISDESLGLRFATLTAVLPNPNGGCWLAGSFRWHDAVFQAVQVDQDGRLRQLPFKEETGLWAAASLGPDGALYVIQSEQVRRLDATGIEDVDYSRTASAAAGALSLYSPSARVAVDRLGRLVVAGSEKIVRFTPSGALDRRLDLPHPDHYSVEQVRLVPDGGLLVVLAARDPVDSPLLLRWNQDLREDQDFEQRVAHLAGPGGALAILGVTSQGDWMVAANDRDRRLVLLDPQGQVRQTLPLAE